MLDIIYDSNSFILELPDGTPGGIISGYSLDGSNYDFSAAGSSGGETSHVFIS